MPDPSRRYRETEVRISRDAPGETTPPSSRHSHTQQSYQHLPLHPTSKEFRLLRFCCRDVSESSEVKCELRIFDLKRMGRSGAPAQYTALSYTWGTSLSRSHLMINGAYLEIGPNLYAYCKEFCRSQVFEGAEWTGWIWIDQICINQSDLSERNHQVDLMADIYGRCESTIIWMHNITEHGSGIVTTLSFATAMEYLITKLLPLGPPGLRSLFMEDASARDFSSQCLRVILRHPYFTRLWIVQEVLLSAQKNIMMQGGRQILWAEFYKVYESVRSLLGFPDLDSQENAADDLLDPAPDSPCKLTPFDCIAAFSTNKCQDPRDKIFGMMGLIGADQIMQTNYDCTIQDVLIGVLCMIIYSEFDLSHRDILVNLGVNIGLSASDQRGWASLVQHLFIQENKGRFFHSFYNRSSASDHHVVYQPCDHSEPACWKYRERYTRGWFTCICE